MSPAQIKDYVPGQSLIIQSLGSNSIIYNYKSKKCTGMIDQRFAPIPRMATFVDSAKGKKTFSMIDLGAESPIIMESSSGLDSEILTFKAFPNSFPKLNSFFSNSDIFTTGRELLYFFVPSSRDIYVKRPDAEQITAIHWWPGSADVLDRDMSKQRSRRQ